MVRAVLEFKKRDLFWVVPLVMILVVGIVVAVDPAIMGHGLDEVAMPACVEGEFLMKTASGWGCGVAGGGEVRIWQNMGKRTNQDNQDHVTSCDSGYLMSGLRIYGGSHLDGRMVAHCTESSLTLSGSTTKTGPATNADNRFHNVNCNAGQVIKSVTIRASGNFDGNIRLDCRNLVGGSLDDSNIVWAVRRYHGVNNDERASDVNAMDGWDHEGDCPYGYVAAGVRFYASGSFESFDILCKRIV